MGIIKRGILGGFANKVANVVGTSWKGRAIIKSLPLSVANPRTTPQVNQRTKFKTASQYASLILGSWIKPLWDRFSGDIAGVNAWMKTNVENFTAGGGAIFADLVMSKGKMVPVSDLAVVADVSADTVSVDFTFPTDPTWGQTGESAFIQVFNVTKYELIGVTEVTGNPADVQSIDIPADNLTVGDLVSTWVSMKRADGTQVSNSAYLSVSAVA